MYSYFMFLEIFSVYPVIRLSPPPLHPSTTRPPLPPSPQVPRYDFSKDGGGGGGIFDSCRRWLHVPVSRSVGCQSHLFWCGPYVELFAELAELGTYRHTPNSQLRPTPHPPTPSTPAPPPPPPRLIHLQADSPYACSRGQVVGVALRLSHTAKVPVFCEGFSLSLSLPGQVHRR